MIEKNILLKDGTKGTDWELIESEAFAPFLIGSVYQYLHQVYLAFFGSRHVDSLLCSSYAKEALSEYGIRKGLWLSVMRIIRCNPFGGKGYDPVPQNLNDRFFIPLIHLNLVAE